MAKMMKVCETCGNDYFIPAYRFEKSRFCSKVCRSSFVAKTYLNKGPKPWAAAILAEHRHKSTSRFKSGHTPWNKDMKGIHLSPDSEYKKGRKSEKHLPIMSETIRIHRGFSRRFIKVSEPNVWVPYARYVWESANGPIPKSWIVHHKDRDTLNDDIGNLQAMTKKDHMIEHYGEIRDAYSATRRPDMFVQATADTETEQMGFF